MTCIDLMSKRSKQRKTPNAIKFRWICIDLTSKLKNDVQMIKNVELRRKPFKTAKLQKWSNWTSKRAKMMRYVAKHSKLRKYYEIDQITMNCIHLTSKRSKMLSYVANHSKPLNYKSDQIGRQSEQKWWVTSQNIQYYAKLRNRTNYNELHTFDVKTI